MSRIARMICFFCVLGVAFVNESHVARAAFPAEQMEEQQQLLEPEESVEESVVLYRTSLSAAVSDITENFDFSRGTYDIEINNTGAYPLKYRLHQSGVARDAISGTVQAHGTKQVNDVVIGDVSMVLKLSSRKEVGFCCCGRYVKGAEGNVAITYRR